MTNYAHKKMKEFIGYLYISTWWPFCFRSLAASPVSSFTDVTVAMNYDLIAVKSLQGCRLAQILGEVSKFIPECLSTCWCCTATVLSSYGLRGSQTRQYWQIAEQHVPYQGVSLEKTMDGKTWCRGVERESGGNLKQFSHFIFARFPF